MLTGESQSSRIQTRSPLSNSDPESPVDRSFSDENLDRQSHFSSAGRDLFASVCEVRTPLPERFPRLTFLAIAVALLAFALTAEFDYLRGAGYYWP